jgi:PiT family inorganic phosphate transporter
MSILLIVILVLAIVFDYINGFHDAANSIATIVSTKVLTPFQAVVWAALFNFLAFFIFRDHGVANTIAKTVKADFITLPVILSGLIAAISWNLLTWWFAIPSSSSHTLIGGFAGAAIAHAGFNAVNPEPIIKTVSFIVLAPFIGMFIAFIISLWFIYSFRRGIVPKIISLRNSHSYDPVVAGN